MYRDIFKVPYLEGVVYSQDTLIKAQEIKLDLRNQMVALLKEDNESKEEYIEELLKKLTDSNINADALKEENQDITKALRLWKTGAISVTGLLLTLILIIG